MSITIAARLSSGWGSMPAKKMSDSNSHLGKNLTHAIDDTKETGPF